MPKQMKPLLPEDYKIELLEDLGMCFPLPNSKIKKRTAIFKCPSCSEPFKAQAASMKKKERVCSTCSFATGYSATHGDSGTRLHTIWNNMRARSGKHKNYLRVKVEKEWLNYSVFKEWALNNGYTEVLTIDRIDGSKGYNPKNCRWASMKTQAENRGLRSDNKSGYKGVVFHNNSYEVTIQVDGKPIYLGSSKDKVEAAKLYDRYIHINNLEHTPNGVLNELELSKMSPQG